MKRKIISEYGIGGADRRKASAGASYDTMTGDFVTPQIVKISDEEAYRFFHGNEWVNSVVNREIDDCTKIKPIITLIDKSKELKPRHKRMMEQWDNFVLRPNPNKESFASIREKFIKDMLVVGRGTDEKVFDEYNVLKEFYALSAKTMRIKTDDRGMIPDSKAFVQRNKKGKDIHWDKNEIIWTVFRPESGTAYGEKPLDTLANAVATDILRAFYNSNFFTNSAEAGGILQLDGMSKTELKKFRQYWQSSHKGVAKAHRTVAVNVPIKWIGNTITNRDMEFTAYGKELMMKIFAVYSMQPFVMGVVDGTTGKLNSSEQNQVYKDSALKPILRKEAWAYTTEILHDGWGMEEFQVEFEGVDLADAVTQSEIDRMDINSGVIVINEVRQRRGLQPVPWGKTPISILPGGNQIDPETGQLIPPSEQGDNNTDNSDGKKPKETKKPKNGKKEFAKAVATNYMHLKKIFDTEKSFRFLKSSVMIAEYTNHIKDYTMYEGVLKEMCERYSKLDSCSVSRVKRYILERL